MGSFPGARLLVPALAAALIGALALAAFAQGRAERPPRPPISTAAATGAPVSLALAYDSGTGGRRRAAVVCSGRVARAGGYLAARDDVRVCRAARRLGSFLATAPDARRPCTQIYGGPQRAAVRGRVGTRRVNRRFSRTDGCAIADWDRAAALLPATR